MNLKEQASSEVSGTSDLRRPCASRPILGDTVHLKEQAPSCAADTSSNVTNMTLKELRQAVERPGTQAPIHRCMVCVSLPFTGNRFCIFCLDLHFYQRVVTDGRQLGLHTPAPRCTISISRPKLHHEVDNRFQVANLDSRACLCSAHALCTSVCLKTMVWLHFFCVF